MFIQLLNKPGSQKPVTPCQGLIYRCDSINHQIWFHIVFFFWSCWPNLIHRVIPNRCLVSAIWWCACPVMAMDVRSPVTEYGSHLPSLANWGSGDIGTWCFVQLMAKWHVSITKRSHDKVINCGYNVSLHNQLGVGHTIYVSHKKTMRV